MHQTRLAADISAGMSRAQYWYFRPAVTNFWVVFHSFVRVALIHQADLALESEDVVMIRLTLVSVSAILSVAVANAGNIEIGGVNGLTSSYITSGCAGTTCVAGSAGGFSEANYDIRLFQAAGAGTFTPYSTYNGTAAETGTLGTSPQFAMINDGLNGASDSNNFWYAGGTTAIQVPIGLNAINSVSMMLNDIWGVAGANDTVVTFDFANSSNGSTVDQVIVNLTNSGVGGSGASGQIQSSVDCSATCGFGVNNFASGPTLASSTPTATLNGVGTTVTVATQDLYSAAYTSSGITGTSAYAGSSGTINLDALTFTFPAAITSNLYLTEITVADPSMATKVSETALSAITVNVAAPEPSTVGLLLIAGLGLLGYFGIRRNASARVEN